MSRTLLITMLALFATVSAKPYYGSLSPFFEAAAPISAAYSAVPGAIPASLASAVPAAVAAPVPTAYTSGFPYGGFGSLYDARLGSPYSVLPAYGYGYGYATGSDPFIYRR